MNVNTEKPLHILAANLWSREGGPCVSTLVHTLHTGMAYDSKGALTKLTEQASELYYPIDDWESAARAAGWTHDGHGILHTSRDGNNTGDEAEYADSWKAACEISGIEPHQLQVHGHWIVSTWLADRLAEHGEKVDKDFAGLTVWARTTKDHEVHKDVVIEKIAAATMESQA